MTIQHLASVVPGALSLVKQRDSRFGLIHSCASYCQRPLICMTKGVFTPVQALRRHERKVSTLRQEHGITPSAQDSPWQVGSSVFITFKAARVAGPLATRLVPVASRRVLSSWGRLLPHSRVGRGGSGVSGVVVAGHSTPLKANHSPFGVG